MQCLPARYYDYKTKIWECRLDDISYILSEATRMGHTVFYDGKEYSFTPKDKNALEVITACLKTKPYQHQIDSLEYSIDHKKFLLADEQGLGKSLSSLEIALYNKKQYNYKHCLIICGVNGLKYNWFNEVNQHTTESAYILGQRKTKSGLTIGSNKDKLDDLLNLDNLPYFIITNIETLRYKVKTGNIKKIRGKNVEEVEYPIINALNDKSDSINMIIADEIHKCFDYNSMIVTDRGIKSIGDIVENKENVQVLSYDEKTKSIEYKPIKNWFKNTVNQPLMQLTFEINGEIKTIKCTSDHQFLTDRGWIMAKNINESDKILDIL